MSSISATFILTESNTLEVINAREVLFIISFMLFLAFASLTIKPRTAGSGGTKIPKLIFHNDITSKMNREAYSSAFRNASDLELEDDLLFQIYEIASIAEKKYKYYNYSFYTLCIQILFFFLFLI